MAWLQSETKLRSHPKLKITAQQLGITKVEMIGYLHLFWYWILEYHEDGNLKTYGNTDDDKKQFLAEVISEGAEWTGEPMVFFDALLDNCWIDEENGRYTIHDWNDLSGKYAIQKEQTRLRQAKHRAKNKKKIDDEFYNPSQIDTQAEVWDGDIEIIDPEPSTQNNTSQTIFAALTRTIRGNWDNMTENERGRYNAATAQLVAVNATPEDIEVRYNHYIQAYGRKPTPSALVSHWGDLASQPINLSNKDREKLTTAKIKQMEAQDLKEWADSD